MSRVSDPDRLYKLLPVVYRQRDAEQGWPLQALLRVIADQVNLVEDDIAQLYENWFIETCQDWVVPYIGDLVGYQVVHEAGEPGDVTTAEGQLRNSILIPRADVANTIHDRRRKGTRRLLEELASEVAGWPAHAVEFYRLLGWTQNLNSLYRRRGRTVDLRRGDALQRLNGPFDEVAHTIDVRRIVSQYDPGRYNIPGVGLFVWRLNVYSVTHTRAFGVEEAGPEFFTFSILGNDTPLYTKPVPLAETQHRADELNFPTPIRRRLFEERLQDYYGSEKSLFIWVAKVEQQEGTSPPASRQAGRGARSRSVRRTKQAEQAADAQQTPPAQPAGQPRITWDAVDVSNIVAADLSDWRYHPQGMQVAVDPVLGRIAFSLSNIPEGGVRVSYHYAFSADIGGGEYNRPLFQPNPYYLLRVSKGGDNFNSIKDALQFWRNWKQAHAADPHNAVIEITDSGVYTEERLRAQLEEGEHLQIRAANRKRPVIRLLDRHPDRTDSLELTGEANVSAQSGGYLTLDGLLITGRSMRVEGNLAGVTIRHCTLVPGWEIDEHYEPKWETEPSLELVNTSARVTIEHSILGPILVDENEVTSDPVSISISDSILDAAHLRRGALGGLARPTAYAQLTITRCTVFGRVRVRAIELAENSIFNDLVLVARSQSGCVRFCYVPEGSRTPRRYNCQPDLVKQAVSDDESIPNDEKTEVTQREVARVVPIINSKYYGTPTYCQLAGNCADEIKRGADDESEMGVFHDLFQPQREANLRARLDDFTPSGNETGIINVN
jgi:hypothetical protein